ncbi:cytidylate kinase [Candidatus Uhrbacteria bacterium]|nr:cytidylate kinase [Candidatus Uhrbacteria bacterium]
MIITISGFPGAGKSSVGKMLAQRLGMNFYSMGGLVRKMAAEQGMTVDEFYALGDSGPTQDEHIDAYQKELASKEDQFVMEGRISWHFIPQSFKILLICSPDEAARRVFTTHKDERLKERAYASLEETKKALSDRVATEVDHYQRYYGIDYRDQKQYDLVIDTTKNSGPEETVEQIMKHIT